jgi:hypothetical protein
MFRVRDGVKFGASRMCPMCNSGFERPVHAAGVQTPDGPLRPCLQQFKEDTK